MTTKDEVIAERDRLRNDLRIITERLTQEASDRSWCGEYNDITEALNVDTSEPHFGPYRGKATLSGQVTLAFSDLTVEIDAETDAGAAVRNWFTENVVRPHYPIDNVRSVDATDGA